MQVTYRFVSFLNEQNFIEGRYVPVVDGKPVASEVGDSVVTEAKVPEKFTMPKETHADGEAGTAASEPASAPAK